MPRGSSCWRVRQGLSRNRHAGTLIFGLLDSLDELDPDAFWYFDERDTHAGAVVAGASRRVVPRAACRGGDVGRHEVLMARGRVTFGEL